MIKEIFFPEKVGAHRILSQRILSLSIHDDCIRFALVHARRDKSILEILSSEPIEQGLEETRNDRVVQSLKKILLVVKSYDQIRVCVPASVIVFKDLILQFTDPEKIRMVLEYEIESMLPFSINDAVTDFIITKVVKEPPQAHVLVAALRNQDLQAVLDIYIQAGIDPTCVTIDLFALYSLYQQISEYKSLANATALVELGAHATRVAFIQDGQLRLARYIQRGLSTVIKMINEETGIAVEEIQKRISSNGLNSSNDDQLSRVLQQHFVLLLNDIQFTLNSFSLKLNFYEGVSKVLFSGYVYQIPDMMKFCTDTLQISCEIFDSEKLFLSRYVKSKIKQHIAHWSDFDTTLGVALPSREQDSFNLRRRQFSRKQDHLIVRQLITASVIFIAMLTALGVKGYFDLSELALEAQRLEMSQINTIKSENIFEKDQFPKKPGLSAIVREAEKVVNEKMDLWAPFFQQRMRPLELWLELTRLVNKKQFDVIIREISFSTDEKGWERDKDGSIKKDAGIPKIEIEGLFKSKTGDHFVNFMALENRFKESTILKLIEPLTQATPAPDGGVNFVIKMRLKETS